jgi:hypothetical protein
MEQHEVHKAYIYISFVPTGTAISQDPSFSSHRPYFQSSRGGNLAFTMSRGFWSSLVFSAILSATHVSANNAIDINTNTQNQKHVQIAITEWGSDFYYAIMSCMGATALGIIATSYMKPRSDRVFFYLCATICMVATVAYFAMGSNLGWTPIDVEWMRNIPGVEGRNREIFYARYIDW